MDLVSLITACALAVDPKLMHALVWHQSGGEPWAVQVHGEPNPRVYSNMQDAIREIRSSSAGSAVRVGLAGIPVAPSKVSSSVLLPCRNVAMAALQISRNTTNCKTHPRLKGDPTFCAIAVYRGSWAQPDIKFATDVTASVANGDAPNFDMPRGTGTEIFDVADDTKSDVETAVIDITTTVADQVRGWSSTLFPRMPGTPDGASEGIKAAPPSTIAAPPTQANPQDRGLFVRRSTTEASR